MTLTDADMDATLADRRLACGVTAGHAPDCTVDLLGTADGTERCAGPCGRGLEPGESYTLTGVERRAGALIGDVTCLGCAAEES